jgi:hypothetical protein
VIDVEDMLSLVREASAIHPPIDIATAIVAAEWRLDSLHRRVGAELEVQHSDKVGLLRVLH